MRYSSTNRHWAFAVAAFLAASLLAGGTGFGRALESPATPADQDALAKSAVYDRLVFETRLHYAGNVWLAIANYAQLGTAASPGGVSEKDRKALKINYSPSFEFPSGTRNDYLFIGGFWFGGIVGKDTLVSRTVKGNSTSGSDEINGFDTVSESSNIPTSIFYDSSARAEQEYYCSYTDTLVLFATDEEENRNHKPVGIEVHQTSYAWSQETARNFVIVEFWILNVSDRPISSFVLGVFADYDIFNILTSPGGSSDDISGFLSGAPNLFCRSVRDSMNVAWAADNDGDPLGGVFPLTSTYGVVGTRFLYAPPSKGISFNWWTLGSPGWGPAIIGSGDPVGAPVGDRRTYYLMANQTIDYGQVYSALDYSAIGWRPPVAGLCGVAAGADSRQMLSCGPLREPILDGDSVRFALAFLAGDNFHTDPNPEEFDCEKPDEFFAKKNFDDLATSAQWAGWIYDTPGFDGDGDGYAGEFDCCDPETTYVNDVRFVTCGDTIPVTGDLGPPPAPGGSIKGYGGYPDLAMPSAPPPPLPGDEGDTLVDTAGARVSLVFETRPDTVILRWVGRVTETSKDSWAKKILFEGYKLYISREKVVSRFSLLSSWDKEDYRRYVRVEPDSIGLPVTWVTDGSVLSIEDLRRETGDSVFNPNSYDSISCAADTSGPGCFEDSVRDIFGVSHKRRSFFRPVGANRGNVYTENRMIEANIIQRDSVRMTVTPDHDTLYYGFYHATLTGLNPSVGYYVAVTAFDFGDLNADRSSMESDIRLSNVSAVPIYSASVVEREGLRVAVYPNPYKIEYDSPGGERTSYYAQGYEAPEKGGDPQSFNPLDRRINFINLPDSAVINIYSLDGDLVRTIEHGRKPDGSYQPFTTYSSKCSWDLVTRNTQAVVSGIYIYRIDSKLGSQVGKIVVIK